MRLAGVPLAPTLLLVAATLVAQAPRHLIQPPIVPDSVARDHVAELVTVEGVVVSVAVSERSDTVRLNLGPLRARRPSRRSSCARVSHGFPTCRSGSGNGCA